MKVGVLTSSRADYGIYTSLLMKLSQDARVELHVIAFGMHLLEKHGPTISQVIDDSYGQIHVVKGMPEGDTRSDINLGYIDIMENFNSFWSHNQFDLVFVLGDRWEMSAAVQSSIPYEVKLAHIHGGETTLGATDNIYRHQISLASKLHFTATEAYLQRVSEIIGETASICNIGSISLEGIDHMPLPEWQKVKREFQIPFNEFILTTIHPETVNADRNAAFASLFYETLDDLSTKQNFLITAANADVMGTLFNNYFRKLASSKPNKVMFVPSMGKMNYFAAMKRCSLLLGNTSSGIIEAASFKKWVINLGDRQKGRIRSGNTIDIPFDKGEIIKGVNTIQGRNPYEGTNKYYQKNPTDMIISRLFDQETLKLSL